MKISKDHDVLLFNINGLRIFNWQYDLYLNSKVAPDTCNATGLWLILEPESKIVPLIYSHGDYSTSERITHFMVILCKSYIKQNKQTKTANAISKYLSTRGAKQLFLIIEPPFTDFFCTPCRDSEMIEEDAQGKQSPSGYLHNVN